MQNDYSDPRWQKLRLQCMSRDEWKCVACGDDKSTLHVHHKRYCGDIWESPLSDLQTLCGGCHTSLGQHPKAGVWYERISDIEKPMDFANNWHERPQDVEKDAVAIAVQNCPQCSGREFTSAERLLSCFRCGWSMQLDRYTFLHPPASLISEQKAQSLTEEEEQAKKSQKALGQLKAWARKCREYGFSDADVWSAAFPEQAVPFGFALDHEGHFGQPALHVDEIARLRAYLTSGMSFHDIAWELLGDFEDLCRRMRATGHAPEALYGR